MVIGSIVGMKIRFLRNCTAPQQQFVVLCECCGREPNGYADNYFMKDEEIDPLDPWDGEVDLNNLKINEDYLIIEWP